MTSWCTGTVPRASWCRRRCGSGHRWRCCSGALSWLGGGIRPAGGRSCGASHGLLQLHELARCHGFAHAAGHAGALRAARTGSCRRSRTTTTGGAAIPADRLADQLQRVATSAGRCAGSCRTPGAAWTLRDTGAGALRSSGTTARRCSRTWTSWDRFAHQFRAGCWPRGLTGSDWSCWTGRSSGSGSTRAGCGSRS